jgi:hypothetical protein
MRIFTEDTLARKRPNKFGFSLAYAYLCIVNRTFHHHISFASVVALALLGLLALYFFWHRESAVGLLVAVGLSVMLVMVTERLLHTEYVFCDQRLIVGRGRFARKLSIAVDEITEARHMKVAFGTVNYILICYGAGHQVAVQPAQPQAFLSELRQRQQHNELSDEDDEDSFLPADASGRLHRRGGSDRGGTGAGGGGSAC